MACGNMMYQYIDIHSKKGADVTVDAFFALSRFLNCGSFSIRIPTT